MQKHFYLFFLSMLFYAPILLAQEQSITGKITSADNGETLVGVSVVIKGKNTGVSSDANGTYSIKAQSGDVLVFSSIGFSNQEKTVGSQNTINVKMGSSTNALDEVVVVGYGTQKRANLTGAVSTVDVQKNLRSRPLTDVGRGLQGAVPGLTITSATGDIGANPKIRLRGVTGSLNAGPDGAKPLILVDNVEIPSLQSVNPDDIESISVLKDAASTSIYGTRGAFGVILITTKTGKKNAPNRISYSNNLSWSSPTVTPKLADAVDNATASLLAAQRFNPNLTEFNILPGFSVSPASIEKTRQWKQLYGNGEGLGDEMVMGRDFEILGGKLFYYRQWDPEDKYIRNSTPQQNHDLSVSGGSEKISYNMGLGYLNQTGLLKQQSDQFNRYNFTLGVNASVTDWLDARGKIIYSNTKTETPFIFSGTQYGPLYYLYRWPSNYPYGTYKGLPFRSAISEVQQANMDETRNNLSRISAGGTFKIIPGLTIDADYTFSGVNEHLRQVGGGTSAYDFWSFNGTNLEYKNYQSAAFNKVRYYSNWSQLNTGKAFATYSKNIKDHALKFILGGDIEHFQLTDQSSERRNLLDPSLGEIPLATGDQYVDGSNNHWSTLGAFGRINYAYKDKYLLELNGRFDGSSRFPVNDLWGFFPSGSAGYVLSQEDFMEWSKPFLSFFKVRGSYGSVGNQAIGSATVNGYFFLPIMPTVSSGWVLPTGNAVTVNAPPAYSPTLTWESIRTLDFGLDTRFFKDKIGLSFDWYRRTTANMITAGVNLPASYGTGPARRNFGELQADGFELAIDFNHTFSNGFHFTVTGTLSDAIEKITRFPNATKALPGPIAGINTTYYEGMQLGDIWGYETDRLFSANDFNGQDAQGKYIYKPGIASQSKLESGSFYYGPGDVKYKDLNGDGVIFNGTNTLDDHGDTRIIGNSTPRYQYGFRLGSDWKGFDLDMYFQGVGKRQLWASGPNVFPGFRSAEAWFANQMDYWTPQNPDAFYPRPTDYGAAIDRWDYLPQTRYLLNMAYLRLKNLTFGYTLPKRITDKIKANRIRIYFSGENLLTFDNLDVPIDPEVDFSQTQLNSDRAGFGRVYPYRKTFSGGLQVTF